MLGWGTTIFLRAIVLLFGLLARRGVLDLALGEERFRFAALNARQPRLKPILAYFFGSPGRATDRPYLSSYLMIEVSYAYDKPILYTYCSNGFAMGEESDLIDFGPSERYLPALKEGEALTFRLNDVGVDVDTEFGQKLQFSITVINHLSSSPSSIKEGNYIWNTTCRAAKDLHNYFVDLDQDSCDKSFVLKAEEYGYRIKEVA